MGYLLLGEGVGGFVFSLFLACWCVCGGFGGLYRVVFRVFELLFWFVLVFGIVLE